MIRPNTGYSSIKDRKVELFLNQSESLLSDDSTSSLPIFLGADLNQRPILLLMSSSLKRTPRVDLMLSKKFKDVHRRLYHLFPETKKKNLPSTKSIISVLSKRRLVRFCPFRQNRAAVENVINFVNTLPITRLCEPPTPIKYAFCKNIK